MTLKPALAAVALMLAVSAASATSTVNVGPTTLTYDETTTFGSIAGPVSSSSDRFGWTIPNSVGIVSTSFIGSSIAYELPSFTLTANAGYQLSGFSAFLGSLAFTEFGGGTTSLTVVADVSVNGGPATHFEGPVNSVITSQNAVFTTGYYSQIADLPGGPFSSITVNAALLLDASGSGPNGSFANIGANPQNKLEFSFTAVQAAPVPEPEAAAMLLAGLVAMGWMTQRRRND
jgi:hypothetical protein